MIDRRLYREIEARLAYSPTVALMGPRQVGKTTLAMAIAAGRPSAYLDLENRRDLERIRAVEAFHQNNRSKLIILDEVQRAPELFASLRGIIDHERREGNDSGLYLFLGSASIDLLQQSSESLAGRISCVELHQLDLLELEQGAGALNRLWVRGGFPKSYLAPDSSVSMRWRTDLIRTYLERDIPQLGPRIPAETLRRFWTMLAHQQGTLFNAANLAKGLGVSAPTVARYLDLMVDLLLVRRLQPWSGNTGKRLTKSPKVYVRDSGINHALLGIESLNDLLGHPVAGSSWEGLVIENILAVVSDQTQSFFYRSSGGAEIDLVLELKPGKIWAIEIKRSSSPSVDKGFHSACDDIKPEEKFVVYPGDESYATASGVTVIGLEELMRKLAQI